MASVDSRAQGGILEDSTIVRIAGVRARLEEHARSFQAVVLDGGHERVVIPRTSAPGIVTRCEKGLECGEVAFGYGRGDGIRRWRGMVRLSPWP